MNASKTLTSLVAAAAIVGSVGFAYAQTATSAEPATTPNTEVTPAPMAPAQDTLSAPATSPAPADTGMASEPAPKADRN
ncbi:MAG: hypothetical protein ABL916_22440 [Burkholderiaceae bacterium]